MEIKKVRSRLGRARRVFGQLLTLTETVEPQHTQTKPGKDNR